MTKENHSNVKCIAMQPLLVAMLIAVPAERQAPAAGSIDPLELTQDEKRVLALFRATHETKQHAFVGVAESFARNCPRYVRPSMRLVSGGAE